MFELPRAQQIAALAAITLVVVITMTIVNFAVPDETPEVATVDPNATATPIPVLGRPRGVWNELAPTIRGAAGTKAPVPCPFIDERELEPNNFLSLTPALTFICDQQGQQARPVAAGRIVMIIRQAPLNSAKAELLANGDDGPWTRAATYGHFIAIDHGPLGDARNVTTIYAGLDAINSELKLGQLVDTSTNLGSLGARRINDELVNGMLSFELLSDDTRFGADPLRESPLSAAESAALADLLAPHISLPIETCTLPWGVPDLMVGAPRAYRSGTHNGLDFNCGTTNHDIIAAADGEVVFVVNDYVDAATSDRDAVLDNAALAVDTPFWTLAMLYGNAVVMAHDLDGVDGRVVTISAHMSSVDPDIVPGALIEAGTRLGSVGNRGTSAASAGRLENDPSIHLHWELHVNDRPVGYLADPFDTEPLYRQILCAATEVDTPPDC